jgi:hypothetical protein
MTVGVKEGVWTAAVVAGVKAWDYTVLARASISCISSYLILRFSCYRDSYLSSTNASRCDKSFTCIYSSSKRTSSCPLRLSSFLYSSLRLLLSSSIFWICSLNWFSICCRSRFNLSIQAESIFSSSLSSWVMRWRSWALASSNCSR